ncbi:MULTISPECIES: I78 family peptidase inhibitor [Sphingomonas]|uniref:I78 family peptidase inhibitor n=1 Tax=Sphingomonas TaxID=13687 RepID=UPI000DEF6994|nr:MULTISPECIES: I78 family peptidase inhibitor [Sphingomonas]
MTRRLAVPLIALLLGGCVTLFDPGSPPKASCSADELTDYVGKTATAKLGEDIMQAAGAKMLQWLQPGQAATMDFRGDRLRVQLDANNKVVSARCG